MRYRLRTLLIVLAVGPPLLAGVWFAAQWPPSDWLEWLSLAALLLAYPAYIVGLVLAVKAHNRWLV